VALEKGRQGAHLDIAGEQRDSRKKQPSDGTEAEWHNGTTVKQPRKQ